MSIETKDLPSAIQAEVARLRKMIAQTKALIPGAAVSWVMYERVIDEAERAVREQDAAAMVRILPKIQAME